MEIYKKLKEAREIIKGSTLKKSGRNTYSKYDYFTPEQVNKLVFDAESKTGLFHKFDLVRGEFGLHGILTIIHLETEENCTFTQASDVPSITATNISQQIGGAVTFTNRYLLMTAFDIVDNNLDFDSKDNREKTDDGNPWLNPGNEKWVNAVKYLKGEGTMPKILKKYKVSKINQEKLMEESI